MARPRSPARLLSTSTATPTPLHVIIKPSTQEGKTNQTKKNTRAIRFARGQSIEAYLRGGEAKKKFVPNPSDESVNQTTSSRTRPLPNGSGGERGRGRRRNGRDDEPTASRRNLVDSVGGRNRSIWREIFSFFSRIRWRNQGEEIMDELCMCVCIYIYIPSVQNVSISRDFRRN